VRRLLGLLPVRHLLRLLTVWHLPRLLTVRHLLRPLLPLGQIQSDLPSLCRRLPKLPGMSFICSAPA